MFQCQPSTLKFLTDAPIQLRYEVLIASSIEEVFAAMSQPSQWLHWFPDMTAAKWVAGEECTGASRKVTLNKVMHFNEQFILWQAPSCLAYQVTSVNLPYADELVECFRLNESSDGVLVDYQIGLRLHRFVRPMHCFILPLAKKSYARALLNLKEYVEA